MGTTYLPCIPQLQPLLCVAIEKPSQSCHLSFEQLPPVSFFTGMVRIKWVSPCPQTCGLTGEASLSLALGSGKWQGKCPLPVSWPHPVSASLDPGTLGLARTPTAQEKTDHGGFSLPGSRVPNLCQSCTCGDHDRGQTVKHARAMDRWPPKAFHGQRSPLPS